MSIQMYVCMYVLCCPLPMQFLSVDCLHVYFWIVPAYSLKTGKCFGFAPLALPRPFLGTSLALFWHFLGTSWAIPWHFLGTSLVLPWPFRHFFLHTSALPGNKNDNTNSDKKRLFCIVASIHIIWWESQCLPHGFNCSWLWHATSSSTPDAKKTLKMTEVPKKG